MSANGDDIEASASRLTDISGTCPARWGRIGDYTGGDNRHFLNCQLAFSVRVQDAMKER